MCEWRGEELPGEITFKVFDHGVFAKQGNFLGKTSVFADRVVGEVNMWLPLRSSRKHIFHRVTGELHVSVAISAGSPQQQVIAIL